MRVVVAPDKFAGTLTAVEAADAIARGWARRAPDDELVAVPMSDGTVKFNKLADNSPNIESCAASLESMRLRFLRMGGSMQEIMGAYNGQYLFLQKEGVFSSTSIDGPRYILLVRTGDGRLAKMGALPATCFTACSMILRRVASSWNTTSLVEPSTNRPCTPASSRWSSTRVKDA